MFTKIHFIGISPFSIYFYLLFMVCMYIHI